MDSVDRLDVDTHNQSHKSDDNDSMNFEAREVTRRNETQCESIGGTIVGGMPSVRSSLAM